MSTETVVKEAIESAARLLVRADNTTIAQIAAQVMVAQSIDRLTELLRPTITEINALIERAKAEEAAGRGAKR